MRRLESSEATVKNLRAAVLEKRAVYPAHIEALYPPAIPSNTFIQPDPAVSVIKEDGLSEASLTNLSDACQLLTGLVGHFPKTVAKLSRASTVIEDEEAAKKHSKSNTKSNNSKNNNATASTVLTSVDPARLARARRASRQFDLAAKLVNGGL